MLYTDYLPGDYFEADPEDIREKIEKVNEQLVEKLYTEKLLKSSSVVEQYYRAFEISESCGFETRPWSWIFQN